MDIYKYIPSKDIREYLQKIGYEFSALQAAYIIWNNKNITLNEKHIAFAKLIDEYPDEEIKGRMNTKPRKSLHAFLDECMTIPDFEYGAFFDNEAKNAVYRYRFYCKGDCGWCENFEHVFQTYEDVEKALQEDADLPIEKIQVKKSYFDKQRPDMTITQNKNGDITELDCSKTWAIEDVFLGYWIDIPLPFKRGDILVQKRSLYDYLTQDEEPFVLYACHNWRAEDYKKNGVKLSIEKVENINRRYARYKENGDFTDTFPCGYVLSNGFAKGANKIYRDVIDGIDVLSLEYYRGELTGGNRLLSLLSKRIKGEIDDELFAHGHFLISQEEYMKEYKRYMCFTKEAWEKMGVEE